MQLIMLCGVLLSLLAIGLLQYYLSTPKTSSNPRLLPPGKTGWPVIGESIEFLSNMKRGNLEKFSLKRMAKYSPHVFKTSILGDHVAVLCGASGNKFLFSNANKLVKRWMPRQIRKILISNELEVTFDRYLKPALLEFIKADGLRSLVGVMDTMAQCHLESRWHPSKVIAVYPLVKSYTFALACRLFLSIEDPDVVERLLEPMETLSSGLQSLPLDLPGTPLNRAVKAAAQLKLQIKQIVTHQRLMESSSVGSDHKNLLSHFLQAFEDDKIVADCILGMLVGGHETATSTLCMIFKVLADYPDVYWRVYQENMEVGAMKTSEELLTWEDTHKLRYTWNVAREVMRLYPAAPFLPREAMTDFTYAGFHIPKGYKLITNVYGTHKDPEYFPEPEKLEPSRFEGDGPLPYTFIPFGGGTTMCPGRNYAQLEMLVFIHNAVKRFKWEPLIPDEKIIGIPLPRPAHDLPVLIHPHN